MHLSACHHVRLSTVSRMPTATKLSSKKPARKLAKKKLLAHGIKAAPAILSPAWSTYSNRLHCPLTRALLAKSSVPVFSPIIIEFTGEERAEFVGAKSTRPRPEWR
jgi:hypothetical protein